MGRPGGYSAAGWGCSGLADRRLSYSRHVRALYLFNDKLRYLDLWFVPLVLAIVPARGDWLRPFATLGTRGWRPTNSVAIPVLVARTFASG